MPDRIIYAFDVGSPTEGLAWARLDATSTAMPTGEVDLDHAVRRIAADLAVGALVAIGFEAPAFVPVPASAYELGRARMGEVRGTTSRPWCISAGAYVTANVLQLAAWVLREVRTKCLAAGGDSPSVTFNPDEWGPAQTLLWEAFVSGEGHARTVNAHGVSEHVQDAATAACSFRDWYAAAPRAPSAVTADSALSTLGACALWAEWSRDPALLSQAAVVLWPDRALGADVRMDIDPSAPPPVTLSLTCGAAKALTRRHQPASHVSDFDRLVEMLSSSPAGVRRVGMSLDGGSSWQTLRLTFCSRDKISWSGVDAQGRANAHKGILVRL